MKKISVLAGLISLALTGCGGGDSAPTPNNPDIPSTPLEPSKPVPSDSVKGTAATGAPILGELTLLDTNGDKLSYVVTNGGKFSFDKLEIKTPAIIKAVGAAAGGSHEVYSVILEGQDVANVTPLTQLLISRIAGRSASYVFDNFDTYKSELTIEALTEAQAELKKVLNPLLIAAGVGDDFDLISSEFEANYKSIDAVLDLISISFGNTGALITYKGDGSYAVELKFNENWDGKKLDKNGVELAPDDVSEPLKYIVTADSLLEAMVVQQDESEYMKRVHPDAFWYGQDASNMFEQKQNILPNEIDEMNRYRDFALTKIEDDGSFLLSYTECYQDSPFATCGRAKAWFAKDSDEQIKFMGRKDKLPLNVSAILIARRGHWQEDQTKIDWSIEIDAFPDASTVCATIPDSFNNVSWFAGVPKLVKMSDYMDIDKVTISGAGITGSINMDSIYKEVNDGEITACHLVDSSYGYTNWQDSFVPYSLVIDGYSVSDDQEIPDNTTYNVEYKYTNGSIDTYEQIKIGKGKDSSEEMAKYIATLDEHRTSDGDFYMRWSRESKLVTDIDVWATEFNSVRGSVRVSVVNNDNEIETDKLDMVERAYLASFDEYGRAISVGYDLTSK